MVKNITKFLLPLSLFLGLVTLFTFEAKATHVMGADIKWKCLGNHVYEFTITTYRDCRGIGSPGSRSINFECIGGATGSATVSFARQSMRDISPFCLGSTGPCSPPNTFGTGRGVEEHVYTARVDFNSGQLKTLRDAGCCRFRISYQECCRNGAISTGASNQNFYTDSEIDLCNIDKSWKKGCDDSPDLRNPPVLFTCCRQPFYFNNGVVDIDGDSIVFTLVPGMINSGTNANYNAPFNPVTWPMTGSCQSPFPSSGPCPCNANLRPPRGFCFDPVTGDLVFVPRDCDQSGVLIIKMEQWRKDENGLNWVYIGYTKRDIQLWNYDCPGNNAPEFEPLNIPAICEGDRICVKIKVKDEEFMGGSGPQPWKDTIDLTWTQGLPGASFDVGDPGFTFENGVIHAIREVEICWQTKMGDGREAPYLFTVNARDRACPMNATSSRGYAIKVNRTAFANRLYSEDGVLQGDGFVPARLTKGDCGKFYMHSIPLDSFWFKGTYFHDWTIRDSTNSGEPVFRSTRRTDSLQFQRGGKYIITYIVNNPPINCPSEYLDTVIIPPQLQVELPKDTFVCEGDTVQVAMNILHGTSPYFKSWQVPLNAAPKATDTFETVKITTLQNINVGAFVRDSRGCLASDTMLVKAFLNPKPFLGPNRRICSYDTLSLKSNYPDEPIWKFHWSPAPLNRDSAHGIWRNTPSKIYHKVIDTMGCWGIDSMELFVNEKVVALAGPDKGVCIFDTIFMEANRLPKGLQAEFQWILLAGANRTLLSSDSVLKQFWNTTDPRKYELFLRVTQEDVSCIDRDTTNLTVWRLPTFQFDQMEPRCYDFGAINLNSAVGPNVRPQNATMSHRRPGIVTGGPGGFAHFFQTDSFPMGTAPMYGPSGTWVQADYLDTNGCYNIDSFRVIINPNPVVEIAEREYCHNATFFNTPEGRFPIGRTVLNGGLVVRASAGAGRTWRILSAPATVAPPTWLSLLIAGVGNEMFLDTRPVGDASKIGDYTLELCVTDNITNCRSCDTATIKVVRLPEIQFLPIPNQCVNFDTLFLDNYVNLVGGKWEVKSGPAGFTNWIIDSTKFMPFRGPGLFELRYTHSRTGCVVKDSTQVNVSPLPPIRLDTFSLVCNTDVSRELRSLNPPIPGANGRWAGFGVTNTGNTYFFNPSASPKTQQIEGPYTLRFDFKHPITQCENFDTFRVRIQSEPEIEITTPKPFQLCEFTPFDLTAEMRFANTITWTHAGDGSFSNPKTLNTVYTHGTNDTLVGTVMITIQTDALGVCPQNFDSAQLIIQPYPQIDFVADTLSGCQPLDVNFSSLVSKPYTNGNLSYYWEFDTMPRTSTEANPFINYPDAGDYTIKLIVVNTNGQCSTELVKTDYISVYPVPVAAFTTNPSYYTTLARPRFRMNNNSRIEFGSMSHFWDFGTDNPNDTSHQFEPEFFYYSDDTGQYLIRLWVESEHGCSDSAEQWVRIGPDVTVYIPNAFSPNDFGPMRNNKFYVSAQGIIAFNVRVFNRWGEKMYESDDLEEGWDGKHNNIDCQQDVYMYIVRVTGFDGKDYEYSGTVTLVR